VTEIEQYILDNGGYEGTLIKLRAHPKRKFNNITKYCRYANDLQSWVLRAGVSTLLELDWYLKGANAECPPVPFALENADLIKYNANDGSGDYPIDIGTLIAQQFTRAVGLKEVHSDAWYCKLTQEQIEWLAANHPALNLPFSEDEAQDCDNARGGFKGWMDNQGRNKAAVGMVNTLHYWDDTFKYAHAVMVAVRTDNTLWQIDPSAKGLRAIPHPPSFPNAGQYLPVANRIEISGILF